MSRRPAPIPALLLALAAPGCLWARGTAEEPIVSEVRLEGVKSFDPDDVAEVLATRSPEAQLFPPKKIGVRLDPEVLAVDARRVEAWYRERGYYSTRVRDVQIVPDGKGRARVVLRVDEGQPVKVRSIAMNGLDQAEPARKRLGRAPLQVGHVFTEAEYEATRVAVLAALRRTGWARAEVARHAQVLPEEGVADVVYEVELGPRLKFGPVFVAGTASVPRDIVRDQATLEVRPGEWYDVTRLEKAQSRVFALGVFAGVRVTAGAPVEHETAIPIVVAVREAPFRTLRFGPGVALESTRWEMRGLAGWTHRNLGGRLRKLSVNGHAGYAWLPTGINSEREGPVAEISVGFEQPAAFARSVDASVRLEVERGLEIDYDFWAQRLMLGLPLRFSSRWSALPSYNLEVYELSNTPTGDLEERPLLENCPDKICLISYFEQKVAHDGRDDPVVTRSGHWTSLSVQEGMRLGGYGYRYLRFLPEVRGFVPLDRHTVLAGRARMGALVPVSETGEPPIVARFFSGGPDSMRGYTTRELGPKGPDGAPIGGNGLVEASVEVRKELVGALSGVLFVDTGQVAGQGAQPDSWRDVLDLSRIAIAVGGGIRYSTPFGPIRFDVGLLPARFDEVNGLGDIASSFPGAVHITIGEAY